MMTRGFTRCAFVVYSGKTTYLYSGFRPVSHADFFVPSRHSHAYGQDERGIYLNNLRRLYTVVESCPPSHWRATTKYTGGLMSNLNTPIPFSFESNTVRAVNNNDECWFVAADVCAVLNIKNTTQALQVLDDDERSMFNIGRSDINGGGGEVNIINESGLYALVLRSRKPEAKRFRKWVTKEVLPAIRKTGSYSTEQTVKHELITKRFLVHFGIDNQLLMKPIPEDAIIIRKEEIVNYIKSSSISTSLLFDIMGACHEEMIYRFKA